MKIGLIEVSHFFIKTNKELKMDLSHVTNGDRPGGPGLLASPGLVLPRHPTTSPSSNLLPNRFYLFPFLIIITTYEGRKKERKKGF